MKNKYFGQIAEVLDKYTVVINRGREHGIKDDAKFKIVTLGEEIIDPETRTSLGRLEILKGKVKVLHVQEKITTLTSYVYEQEPEVRKIARTGLQYFGRETEEVSSKEVLVTLKNPRVGDWLIQISE